MAKKTSSRARAATGTAKKSTSKKAAKPSVKRSGSPKRSQTPERVEKQIERIDGELVKLLSARYDLTRQSIELAVETDPSLAYNPAADEHWFQALEGVDSGNLPSGTLRQIFRELISSARAQLRTTRVAYLGPKFSFSHLAAIERFGSSVDLAPVNTISTVFEEVNRRHATYGIVPIENSTDGRVVDTLSMFTRLPLRICGEVQLAIHLHLLANCPRGEITEIYSKPQALSQCREWLARNMPNARLIPVTSTSAAAQLALTKPGVAAVASAQAAVGHGLQIIAEKIEDNPHNVTRFAIIGEQEPSKTGKDRTAVLLQTPNEPGALHDALNAFKKQNVNLTWIESFPLYGPENGYQFFLDFDGHVSDPAIQKTLAELEKKAIRLEMLGSYPKSPIID